MLFNKSSNGAVELRALTSSFYKNNDYSKIATQITLAEQELIKLVGQAVYNRANAHYNSASYQKESPSAAEALNDELVRLMQMPIAYKATYEYYQLNLVSHEDTGRKVKVDEKNEKMAWEWMLDRDDEAQLRLGNRTADLLIDWLESNNIAEWMDSNSRLLLRSLFVNSTELFHDAYPIDVSKRFFFTVLPFNKEVQTILMRKALGSLYEPLLAYWKSEGLGSSTEGGLPSMDEELNEFYDSLILQLQKIIPMKVMVLASKRLSIQFLPDSVVQHFKSMLPSRGATAVPLDEVIRRYQVMMEGDISVMLDDMKKLIQSANPEAGIYPLLPENSECNKYMRT
tara:strand:+ start:19422 stop:20444 length:1023 start_codon:yes stop_codon:yes gene_type:complete